MTGPTTILFLGANPSGTTRLALDREIREIDQRLRASERRDAFRIEQAWAARALDLQERLLRHRPSIVHFSGHGSAAGELLLEDESGQAKPVTSLALRSLFRALPGVTRCVVLNACFSEAQARAIVDHVDCVIGMAHAVEDSAAIAFAGALYQALGYGEDVQTAFDLGCTQMEMTRAPGSRKVLRDLVPDEEDADGAPHAGVPRLLVRDGVQARRIRLVDAPPGTRRATFPGDTFRPTIPTLPPEAAGPVSSLPDLRPPPSGSALHQLRAAPADFTGREEQLAALRAELRPGGATLAGLTGQGGIGKTALALVLAQHLRERCPDAQIDIDLRGNSADPLTPAQVMAEVIHGLKPDVELPEDQDARGRLYRSLLDGKRALLLLDDARDREQVEPLLPPPGCLVLVTSRQQFTLPGMVTCKLDALDPTDAIALIRSIAPRLEAAVAAKLAELCRYLPLALRAAASTLAERVDLKPARYLEKLQSAEERPPDVDAVLASSIDLLDEASRALWLRLGVFPADFDVAAAAAVGSVDADAAERLLGELLRRHLLEWHQPTERYRIHDLARDYARSRLDPEQREAATLRHAEHFLKVAWKTKKSLEDGAARIRDAVALFDRERGNVTAAMQWAASNMEKSDAAAVLCCKLPRAWVHCLQLRGSPRERIVWNTAGMRAATKLGRQAEEAVHATELGSAHYRLGEIDLAVGWYHRGLALALAAGDRKLECAIRSNLGLARASEGDISGAAQFYGRANTIAREIGYRRGEAAALGNLGLARAKQHRMHEAMDHYQQALAIAREIEDDRAMCFVLAGLASAHASLGEKEQATVFFEEAIAVARVIGDRGAEASTSWEFALVLIQIGEPERAIDAMRVCIDFVRDIAHPDLQRHEAMLASFEEALRKQRPASIPPLPDGLLGTPMAAYSTPSTGKLMPLVHPKGLPADGPSACLVVVHGWQVGARVVLGTAPIELGRAADADVRLDDQTASRRHALISWNGSAYVVRDLGSMKGTYVNDVKVGDRALRDGDRITMGGAAFKFIQGGDLELSYQKELDWLRKFDDLTKVYNKRSFDAALAFEVMLARLEQTHLSLVVLDVDSLQDVNQTHGLLAGNAVLCQLAARVAENIRGVHMLARLGGDTFALLAREVRLESARRLAEELRALVAGTPCHFQGIEIPVTASFGVAASTPDAPLARRGLDLRAKERLHEAKRRGRNRVM